MRLVEDWKKFWKWASVQWAVFSAVVIQLYEQIPQFQQYIPPKVFHYIMTALVVFIIAGRLLKLSPKNADPQ